MRCFHYNDSPRWGFRLRHWSLCNSGTSGITFQPSFPRKRQFWKPDGCSTGNINLRPDLLLCPHAAFSFSGTLVAPVARILNTLMAAVRRFNCTTTTTSSSSYHRVEESCECVGDSTHSVLRGGGCWKDSIHSKGCWYRTAAYRKYLNSYLMNSFWHLTISVPR